MTASTEQERASLSSFIDRAGRDGFDTAHNFFDCGEVVFFNPATADLWNFWQAARRAQVVPKGWKLVPVEPTEEMLRSMAGQFFGTIPEAKAAFDEALAAAPQPPEAACNPSMQPELATKAVPVQMPEACGRVSVDEDGDSEVTWRGGFPPDDRTRLYTEQQVRQLLAAQKFQLDELAMLTRKLVRSLRKAAPGNESAEKALDYLKRKGLAGNPLRTAQEQPNDPQT